MNDYTQMTEHYKEMISAEMESYIVKTGELYDVLKDAMIYSFNAGGKRIRSILVLEFCRMNGGDIHKALPFACAIEMIHCYSLIHDDLPCMDDDDMRRGQPSCHKKFGEANALLAGDALLTLAFDIIASAARPDILSDRICLKAVSTVAVNSGMDGMVGGQVMDLLFENKVLDEQILHHIHMKKTAALIKAACRLGGLAADASDAMLEKGDKYAQKLGLAFQIIDDVLDVIGDEDTLGKPAGSDIDNGKTTFATIYGTQSAKNMAQDLISQAVAILSEFENNAYLTSLTKKQLARINIKA